MMVKKTVDFARIDAFVLGTKVDRGLLELALDFIVSMETDDPGGEDLSDYEARLDANKERVAQAEIILRGYGEAIEPRTLEAMQEAYYSVTNSPKYLASAIACSAVAASLTDAWDGIGPWRK